jgi:hypothetical protein
MTTRIFFSCFAICLLFACTPKTQKQTTETKPTTPPVTEKVKNPCPTFSDAPNPDKALEEFVLYRDFMKANDWNNAFKKWEYVYKNAPAADGKRTTVFTDGMKFYEYFMTQDTTKKEEYIAKIFQLYDEMEKCYSEGGLVTGLKAFDYFFKYPDRISKEEQYALFKKSIEMDGGQPRYFILNPLTSLLVDLTLEEKIPVAEAQQYTKMIRDAIAKGLAECQGSECDNWNIINEYAPARLEAFESIEDFYDCAYYKSKYYPDFEADPKNCELIINVYSRLRWGKCPADDPQLAALDAAYNENCRTASGPSCNDLLREGKYRDAVKCLEDALPNISDNKGKAQYNYLIAQIYFAYLKNFSRARQYALEAARQRPGWGDPYILIGTMYASSGPLCGPGRGWDSQVVVWPAIDMWNKAKSVDPSVSSQANKLINQYTQYMPTAEDIFQRLKKVGDSYFVPCWIQESTIIRAKPD